MPTSATHKEELSLAPAVAEGRASRSRLRRRMLIAAVAVVLALIVGGVVAVLTTSISPGNVLSGATGAPAPAFSLTELSQPGRAVTLSQLTGKDLVLNFWASWCFPCQQEMPVLQSEAAALRGRVRFVGIDSNDTRSAAIGFLEKVHVRYETLFDPGAVVAGSYGLYGFPTTVFVSPDGKVLGRHSGQLDAATLEAAIEQAFGVRARG
ncbi:MAG: TlpA family protein disulfide reductase [Acidimicrobiales bacterium]